MTNWIKKIFDNRIYTYLLAGYMTIQLSTLIIHHGILYIVYELLFFAATTVAVVWIVKYYKTNKKLTPIGLSIILNFIINLILTIVYIPTLILNPAINWGLNGGGGESDPMILLAFFPVVHFIAASVIFMLSGMICKIIIRNE